MLNHYLVSANKRRYEGKTISFITTSTHSMLNDLCGVESVTFHFTDGETLILGVTARNSNPCIGQYEKYRE